ncbi:MAG: hypothetical protein KKA79_04405 [Nanoarchaeota archaeon]|nr:hypothetical protein [Nanoarchaeota archaeon]MCG2717822.1 hypothetical protein [Nanoarchaeota archaeon]
MTIEAIEQAAKTIVESAYEYETALQKKDKKTSDEKKKYILQICNNLKKLVKEEKKNA